MGTIRGEKRRQILEAMKLSKDIQVTVDDIHSSMSEPIEKDAIQDHLEIMDTDFRCVKTQKSLVNGVYVVVSAELTARGRQYLRENPE